MKKVSFVLIFAIIVNLLPMQLVTAATEQDWLRPDMNIDLSGFSDTENHWINETAVLLKNEGIALSDEDGNFNPEEKITRGEFIEFLLAKEINESSSYSVSYSDVSEADRVYPYIQAACENGYIDPILIVDNKFLPDSSLTREEACVFIAKYAEKKGFVNSVNRSTFKDDKTIHSCYKKAVYSAVEKGFIEGYTDGYIRPREYMTKAEALACVKKIYEYYVPLAIYVDGENGSDTYDGTIENPVKTLQKATDIAGEYKNFIDTNKIDHNLNMNIRLQNEIFVENTLALDSTDSPLGDSQLIYSSYGEEQAVISGGKHFKGNWQDAGDRGIKKLYVGTDIKTRQMFVNGMRMTRARTDSGFKEASYLIKEDKAYYTEDDIFVSAEDVAGLEMVFLVTWTEPRITAVSKEISGDGCILKMQPLGFNSMINKNHLSVNMPDHFENMYEFLDEPGEWYLDNDGWLYYWPYDFINLNTADIVLPVTDGLVTMVGEADNQIKNIAFVDVAFKYSSWMLPSGEWGYSDAQGGRIRKTRDHIPGASVWVRFADNITIEDCTFSKLGASGLNATDNVTDIRIYGNHIYDISGCGMYVGNHGAEGYTIPAGGVAYDPYLSERILISNNFIHDYGIEYGSSDGLEVMAASYVEVSHNEVAHGRYSGIVVGYGKNGAKKDSSGNKIAEAGYKYAIDVENNYVHDVLNGHIYDGGSIYVTELTDGTIDRYNTIQNNYLENQRNRTSILYLDNSSSFWNVNHNVVDTRRMPLWHRNRQSQLLAPMWFSSGGWDNNPVDYNYISSESQNEDHQGGDYTNTEGEAATFGEHIYYVDLEKEQWTNEAKSIIQNAGLTQEYLEKYSYAYPMLEVDTYSVHYIEEGNTLNIPSAAGNYTSSVKSYGRKYAEAQKADYAVYYSTDEPEVISVSSTGVVTPISQGTANVRVVQKVGDVLRVKTVPVVTDDVFTYVETDVDDMYMYVGNSYDIGHTAYTVSGNEIESTATYQSADTSIATVAENGSVTAVKEGETYVTVNVTAEGKTISKTVLVHIKQRPSSAASSATVNAAEYHIVDFEGARAENFGMWYNGDSNNPATAFGDGVRIAPMWYASAYKKYNCDELLRFNMKVNKTGSNPVWLELKASNHKAAYDAENQSHYFIQFREGEPFLVTRYETGVKSDGNRHNGPVQSLVDFKYGTEYEVIIGCVENGSYTEVIMLMREAGTDDEFATAVYWKDTAGGRLKGKGTVHITARPQSSVELMPAE